MTKNKIKELSKTLKFNISENEAEMIIDEIKFFESQLFLLNNIDISQVERPLTFPVPVYSNNLRNDEIITEKIDLEKYSDSFENNFIKVKTGGNNE